MEEFKSSIITTLKYPHILQVVLVSLRGAILISPNHYFTFKDIFFISKTYLKHAVI